MGFYKRKAVLKRWYEESVNCDERPSLGKLSGFLLCRGLDLESAV